VNKYSPSWLGMDINGSCHATCISDAPEIVGVRDAEGRTESTAKPALQATNVTIDSKRLPLHISDLYFVDIVTLVWPCEAIAQSACKLFA
jgi:hypothetical protein